MNIIINTVNLKRGGAQQRAVSFLKELNNLGKDNYHIFLNTEISKQISHINFGDNFQFYLFNYSPANLFRRQKVISKFRAIEESINPQLIFSFVGPAYWKPKSKHLVGFAIPHIVYNDLPYVQKIDFKTKLEMLYKKFWSKIEGDYFVVQTVDVKTRLARKLNIALEKIYVVANGIGIQYNDIVVNKRSNSSKIKLLTISTYRPSKNLEIINEVLKYLENDIYEYEFHLTIQESIYTQKFKKNSRWIVNHGPVLPTECPSLYNQCDIMFLPTHLECFSASYLEAMKMEMPIITTNASFATSICGESALYFDNTNPKEIAKKIKDVSHDKTLFEHLISEGRKKIKEYDTAYSTTTKYLQLFEEIIND